MDAAIKKHGKASIPKSYEEEVQEQINAAKARVAAAQH